MSHHVPENISLWKKYCEGKISDEDKESLDFTFFLNKASDQRDFEDVFSYFPQGDELVARCLNLSLSKRRLSARMLSDQEIFDFVTKDIEEMRKIFIAENNTNFLNLLNTSDFEILNSSKNEYENFYQNNVFNQFIDTINDYVIFNHIKQFPNYLDIESNFYYFSGNDFRLTWYLGEPLIESVAVFKEYHNLWVNFVDYFVTEDGIKIIRTNDYAKDKK